MDKEQAIDLLDNLIGMIEDNQDNDYDTAFRMAIEALKAQLSREGTTFDLISRQAAIDTLKNRWKKTRNYEGIGDDIAEECELYLKQVPSAQPERTCVNCGRTVNNGGWYADGGTRCPIEEHYP